MIYGDQSQEGFLLRDYFCCDTNELRLQIHCRPITPEKRLLAYYTRIISGFYPPCYSSCYTHEHLIFSGCAWLSGAFIFLYMCVSVSLRVHILQLCYSDRQQAIVCDAVLSISWSSSLLIYHFCILCQSSPLDCVFGALICHLCMCHIVTGFCMRDLWLEGNLASRRPTRTEKMRGERGIKISLYSVIGLFWKALSALSTKSCRKPKRGVGEIFWCTVYCTRVHMSVCVCVCVCACDAL